MADRNKEIFDEVQAQIRLNAAKNAEYFAKMDQCTKSGRNFICNMRALKRQNDAIWKQIGIDFDECRKNRENPFLALSRDHPKIFPEMSEWIEKSHKAARQEMAAYGFDFQKIEHGEIKQKFFKGTAGTATHGTTTGKSKKRIRRVRI